MIEDLPPLRAAVLLSKQLTKLTDEASRRCVIRMLNNIRRNQSDLPSVEADEPAATTSRLGRRILKVLGDQKLQAKSIARLCGLSYTGSFRAELNVLVMSERLEKVSNFYTKKCPTITKTEMNVVS